MREKTLINHLKKVDFPFVYVENIETNTVLLHKKQGKLFPKLTKNEFFKNLLDCHVEDMRKRITFSKKNTGQDSYREFHLKTSVFGENFYIFHDFLGLSFCIMGFVPTNTLVLIGAYRTENYTRLKKIIFKNPELNQLVKLSTEMEKLPFLDVRKNYAQLRDEILTCLYNKRQVNFIKITSFLEKNITNTYSLPELSKRFFVTERTIQRYFHKYENMSFSKFYRGLKMNYAKEMIEKKKYDLKEISIQAGYKDFSSFSRKFKEHFGYSPKKYLRQIVKEGEFS
ncbi:Helix-turn-helix domain-containing protein [Pilibacter termitis]|uniref:Helix-turn-helix domain-containing protein n=1 Tax=Pilibacter termitis TaxID=263852 RepID=A0A1T4REV5_9ENTE|nr:AraC family transcriptional regulator [Pilibacter termitis]SKA14542.1 Helix-turn-helix domain-containing protein [Pilibacter termitis]